MTFDSEAVGMRWSAPLSSNTAPVSVSMISAWVASVSIGPAVGGLGAGAVLPRGPAGRGLGVAACLIFAATAADTSAEAAKPASRITATAATQRYRRILIGPRNRSVPGIASLFSTSFGDDASSRIAAIDNLAQH